MKRITPKILITALLLCLLPLSGQAQSPPPAPVAVDQAKMDTFSAALWVSGTVISRHDARIGAETDGRITWVAEVGESVGKDEAFATIDGALGEGPYFRGTDISMVDIAWLPLLHRADLIERHTGYDFLDGYPRVKEWQDHLMKTGLAEKSVADDFESAFTGYYLSDSTFLGNGNTSCRDQIAQRCGNSSCC